MNNKHDFGRFFKKEEFVCKCCGELKLEDRFFADIEFIRLRCDFPFIITSGYRCPKHNDEVGGKPNSLHLLGRAIDIRRPSSGSDLHRLVKAATMLCLSVGIAKDFIHIDNRSVDQNVIWTYYA